MYVIFVVDVVIFDELFVFVDIVGFDENISCGFDFFGVFYW